MFQMNDNQFVYHVFKNMRYGVYQFLDQAPKALPYRDDSTG